MNVALEKYIRQYIICNIPSVHRDLRIHLLDETYKLMRDLLEAEFNKGNIRNKFVNEMLIDISMIDIIFSILYELVNNKKHLKSA